MPGGGGRDAGEGARGKGGEGGREEGGASGCSGVVLKPIRFKLAAPGGGSLASDAAAAPNTFRRGRQRPVRCRRLVYGHEYFFF